MDLRLLLGAGLLLGSAEYALAFPVDPVALGGWATMIVPAQNSSGRPTGGVTSGVPGNGGPIGGGLNGANNGTGAGGGGPSAGNPSAANGGVNPSGTGALRPNSGAARPNGSKPSAILPNGVHKVP